MRTTFISTQSLSNAPRSALPRLQAELSDTSTEITTGRYADVGKQLGVSTAESVQLRLEQAALSSLKDGNASATAQIDRTQTALADIRSGADSFLQQLLAVTGTGGSGAVLQQQASGILNDLTDTLNVTDGRRYLFGGLNSGEKPVAALAEGPGAAISAAFAKRFGLDPASPQTDPKVKDITAAGMADFIDKDLAGFFDEAGWSATWSNGSSENRTATIGLSERVEVSANANEPAMRKLAMAYTMVATLGTQALSAPALQTVIDRSRSLVGTSLSELTAVGARLGAAQNRIDASNEMMQRAQDVVQRRLSALESVDTAEAKTRFDTLSTQIEMSYSLTSRILKMSILNYV
ncbi:flagellar hook-associated family protein [Ancylobacter lacus]|uniref:flagellar hook-associated family protein n=1 Tax=Ancylobacter lacus TaxID=2579970 RepID=UPI001BCD950A|nr:flagellar hook-associated family protein [Ancylobacter lacus]MBS7537958.1 flagellar hook-associated family protein [Ancylobacter lacus]